MAQHILLLEIPQHNAETDPANASDTRNTKRALPLLPSITKRESTPLRSIQISPFPVYHPTPVPITSSPTCPLQLFLLALPLETLQIRHTLTPETCNDGLPPSRGRTRRPRSTALLRGAKLRRDTRWSRQYTVPNSHAPSTRLRASTWSLRLRLRRRLC